MATTGTATAAAATGSTGPYRNRWSNSRDVVKLYYKAGPIMVAKVNPSVLFRIQNQVALVTYLTLRTVVEHK